MAAEQIVSYIGPAGSYGLEIINASSVGFLQETADRRRSPAGPPPPSHHGVARVSSGRVNRRRRRRRALSAVYRGRLVRPTVVSSHAGDLLSVTRRLADALA